MPFTPQETYVEGEIIMVKSYLDTHHNGHMELKACNKGPANCKQEDFDAPANQLIFIEDMVFQGNHMKMPADPNYPGRGMYGGGQGGQTKTFVFKYKLPTGLYGDQVLLQWKYITANSVRVAILSSIECTYIHNMQIHLFCLSMLSFHQCGTVFATGICQLLQHQRFPSGILLESWSYVSSRMLVFIETFVSSRRLHELFYMFNIAFVGSASCLIPVMVHVIPHPQSVSINIDPHSFGDAVERLT
jgi:hypothetical protein